MKVKSIVPVQFSKKASYVTQTIEEIYISITTGEALKIFPGDRENISVISQDEVKIIQIVSFIHKNISHIKKLDNGFLELSVWQSSPIIEYSSLLELSLLSLLTKKPTPDSIYILDPLDNKNSHKEADKSELDNENNVGLGLGFNEAVRISFLLYGARDKKEKAYFSSKFDTGKLEKASGEMPFRGYGEILGYSFYLFYMRGTAELYLSEYIMPNKRMTINADYKPLYFSSTKYPKTNGMDGELSFREFILLFSLLLKDLTKVPYAYRFKFLGYLEQKAAIGYYPEVHTIKAQNLKNAQELLSKEPTSAFYSKVPLTLDDRVFPEIPYDFSALIREGR